MATKQANSKEIIALSTFEAVRLRPTMYIGQVAPMEEKLPIIIDGKMKMVEKAWSPGFMHLIVEILENSLDEAKRCAGKMKNVYVTINLDTNEVTIKDEGLGFHKAHSIHKKTRKNVVQTAIEELHAGSNFSDTDANLLGTVFDNYFAKIRLPGLRAQACELGAGEMDLVIPPRLRVGERLQILGWLRTHVFGAPFG